MLQNRITEGLTFDDVLLVPAYSDILPHEVSVQTRLTRNSDCNIPLLSAAMDTVTEHQVAISMAQEGGLGVIHKNMSVEEQAAQVDRVKRSESGMISDPITVEPEQPLKDALQLMERYRISGVPVTRGTELVGILTNRDLRFETNLDQKVGSVMIGSLFAGTAETPGQVILYQGRRYKLYRGMGSMGAMKEGSKDRYFQNNTEESKLVPEGIEGRVPFKGSLAEMVYQFVGGLRSGMGYTGCRNITELQEQAQFVRITSAGLRESHVHDVFITEEAPNYPISQVE